MITVDSYLAVIGDFKLLGLNVSWLESHLLKLRNFAFSHDFAVREIEVKERLTKAKATVEAIEEEKRVLIAQRPSKEPLFVEATKIVARASRGLF